MFKQKPSKIARILKFEYKRMFKLTQNAADQVRVAARMGGTEDMPLRLSVTQKPDGTMDYKMGFDEGGGDDLRVVTESVEVIMSPEDSPLLDEATMDYVEIDDEYHFIFLNPKDSSYVAPTDN